MQAVLLWAFWLSLGLLVYVHFGYPLVLLVLRRIRPRPVRRGEVTPSVCLLIGAYNEGRVIREKLENCLALNYPRERMRIVVASDASTDETHAIVREYADQGVGLVIAKRRRGKAANFRAIVAGIEAEILVFSDAGSLYRPDTLRKMMSNFADPEIGCVGGRLHYLNAESSSVSQGEGLYWRYEVFLRKAESAIGSTVVLSGAVYAMRRALYRPVPDHLPDDFLSPLHVLDQGQRVIYDADTEILERMATSARSELLTKVRIISQNFAALRSMKHLLNPRRNPLLALQLVSHRLLRWFVLPLALVLALSSLVLARRPLFLGLLAAQLLFYLLAGLGWAMDRRNLRSRLTFIPYYFVLVNFAAAWGVWKSLVQGNAGSGIWEPVER